MPFYLWIRFAAGRTPTTVNRSLLKTNKLKPHEPSPAYCQNWWLNEVKRQVGSSGEFHFIQNIPAQCALSHNNYSNGLDLCSVLQSTHLYAEPIIHSPQSHCWQSATCITAISCLKSWIEGILENATSLHKQSVLLCVSNPQCSLHSSWIQASLFAYLQPRAPKFIL